MGAEAYTVTIQEIPKYEDIKLFDINDNTKKAIFLFTNMKDLKQLFGDSVKVGVVAYGDAMYRLIGSSFSEQVDGMIINPSGAEYCIFK